MVKTKEISISEIGNIFTGNTPPRKNPEYYGNHTLFIKPTDISKETKYTYTPEECYSKLAYEKYKNSLVPKGATCVVTIGSIGEKLTKAHKECFINQAMNAVVPNENFDEDYVYYLLKFNLRQLKMFDSGTASGRENVSKSAFSNIRVIALTSKDEQIKVGKLLSNYDDLIENNNRRIKILEEMAQKIYKEWFVDFKFPGHETTTFKDSPLGKIPNDWEVGKLQDIVEFFNGYAFKSKELLKHPQKNSLSVFKQGHINRGGGFNYSGTKSWFPREKSIELKKYILKKGDLLMAMTDMKNNVAILGNTAIMPMDNSYILNQRVGLLRCKNNLNISYPYVYMVTNSEPFLLNLRSRANSGVQVNLSTEQIKLSKLIIPASHINKLFNELITPIFEQIFLINKKNENLKQTRDILLPRLISGEINVENMEVL